MYKRKADLVFKALVFSCLMLMMVLIMADALAEPLQTRTVTAHGGLNVRREPSMESPTIYLLEETSVVIVHEWKDGWALVANNTPPYLPIGWACGDYLN